MQDPRLEHVFPVDRISGCQRIDIAYADFKKFCSFYQVYTTMEEVKEHILDTFTPPSRADRVESPPMLDYFDKYAITKESIGNSIEYMMQKYYSAFYARIRDGKLAIFCMVKKMDFQNPNHKFMKFPRGKVFQSHSQHYKKYRDLGAVIRTVRPRRREMHFPDYGYYEVLAYLDNLVKSNECPDCDFIISHKDQLVLKRDLTESSEELVGSINKKMDSAFVKDSYAPILSFSCNERYADIPVPTPEDYLRILRITVPDACRRIVLPDLRQSQYDWECKREVALFRGSLTGPTIAKDKNPRVLAAKLSLEHTCISAGITSFAGMYRGRKQLTDKIIQFVEYSKDEQRALGKDFMTLEDQCMYKYILYIEGNVAAFRGATLFGTGAVVLWVPSQKYHLWFESKLVNGYNCIIIKPDLSDLVKIVQWLRANDALAKKIADNGLQLFRDHLTYEPIAQYWLSLMYDLNKLG